MEDTGHRDRKDGVLGKATEFLRSWLDLLASFSFFDIYVVDCLISGLSPTTLQALSKLVNARTVNTALVELVSLWYFSLNCKVDLCTCKQLKI